MRRHIYETVIRRILAALHSLSERRRRMPALVVLAASASVPLRICMAAPGVPFPEQSGGSRAWMAQAVDFAVAGRTPVAISGDWAIVGNSVWQSEQGEVTLFSYTNPVWQQEETVYASDGVQYDDFGNAVAMDGNTAVVGAPGANRAYVFIYQNGSWQQVAELEAGNGNNNLVSFGDAVAVSGDTVVVGAPDEYGTNPGFAYVFVKPQDGWNGLQSQSARLTEGNGANGDEFGYSVGISGDSVVVGGPYADGHAGRADVFVRPANGWASEPIMAPTAELIEPNAQPLDYFGQSVGISQGQVVVAAPLAQHSGQGGIGYAFVYVAPQGGWSGQADAAATLTSGQSSGGFGSSVAADGTTILVDGYALFYKPPGGWSGDLAPSENIGDFAATSGMALSQSAVIVRDTTGVDFVMPFELSLALSDPASVHQGGQYSAQAYLTNSSATASFPAKLILSPSGDGTVVGAGSDSGTCTFVSVQAVCELTPIPGDGGEATATVTIQEAGASGDIDLQGRVSSTSPLVSADAQTTVNSTPLSVSGLHELKLNVGQSGSETFAVNTATDAEPVRVNVTSYNHDLLPPSGIGGASECVSAGQCRLTIKPAAGQSGQTTVMVSVSDAYGRTTSGNFDVAVNGSSGGGGGGGFGLLGLAFLGVLGLLRRKR